MVNNHRFKVITHMNLTSPLVKDTYGVVRFRCYLEDGKINIFDKLDFTIGIARDVICELNKNLGGTQLLKKLHIVGMKWVNISDIWS